MPPRSGDTPGRALDTVAERLARAAMGARLFLVAACVAACLAIGYGATNLTFASDYRTWFSPENPELNAFEDFQDRFVKADGVLFVVERRDGGEIFTADALAAVADLTEASWLLPYARRVDSVTNYQHTYAIGDELIVEDLFATPREMTERDVARRRDIAFGEPLLRGLLVAENGRALAVNVALQFPETAPDEAATAAAAARRLRAAIEKAHPAVDVHLTGGTMLNVAFVEASVADLGLLVPLMIVVILAGLTLAVRSPVATFATTLVIVLSCVAAMGTAGWIGMALTGPSVAAPVIILTLAIADSMHILISMRQAVARGLERRAAIVDAIRINFLPVAVTSITTMIGFLSLQFADSPPFRDLGLIAAIGIFFAWILSIVLLPALLTFVAFGDRAPAAETGEEGALTYARPRQAALDRLARFVIRFPLGVFAVMGIAAVVLVAQIPRLELNDSWREYFAPRIEYRAETDAALRHFGLAPVELAIDAPDAVTDPDYLSTLEDFANWARAHPSVAHVYSLTDLLKRLNRNLNEENPDFYRVPQDENLAAQYLLLYELSLPLGLDLTDRITIDRSAVRMTVTLKGDLGTQHTREFVDDAYAWFETNAPGVDVLATGTEVMFTYIAERNVESMARGTAIAVVAVAVIMMIVLKSVRMGTLSIFPNGLPILATFGVWAIFVGEVGMSVAGVAPVALGIVIDDTVHFLTKYMRARREHGYDAAQSIRYAFATVGVAILINTIVISSGLLMMAFSTYQVNVYFGVLTSLTIALALVFDFLMLPAMILLFARMGDGGASKPASPTFDRSMAGA